MDIQIIDHDDSFTYNLQHLCFAIQPNLDVQVINHDKICVETLMNQPPKLLILSPGPGHPLEVPQTLTLIRECLGKIPLFGVCLGMQALATVAGLNVIKAPKPIHGKKSQLSFEPKHWLFKGITEPLEVVRYHSLCVKADKNNDIKCLAETLEGDESPSIMAIETHPMACGVQFHPESIGSTQGLKLMQNVYLWALNAQLSRI